MAAKKTRCKWFNDLGHPRINPEKQRRGLRNVTGCTRPSKVCHFAHPDHPDWDTAGLSPFLKSHEYPDGHVPRTPTPPSPAQRKRTRSRSPPFRVKPEPLSPKLTYDSAEPARSLSRDRSLVSRLTTAEGRKPLSPYRDNYGTTPHSRDYSGDRNADRGGRARSYSRERGADDNRMYSREERIRDRRDYDSFRLGSGSKSFANARPRIDSARISPPRASSSVPLINRLSPRETIAPRGPASLRNLSQIVTGPDRDRRPLPSTHAPPSVHPPPLPLAPRPRSPTPPSRSSIASSNVATLISGTAPDKTMTTSSFSMPPPPPRPASAASTVTAPQYSLPPKPGFLDAPLVQEVIQKPLTPEERAELWEKRIEALCEVIAAKKAYSDRVADVKQLESLAAPERSSNLVPAARERASASLRAAQTRLAAAQERLKTAHQKLLELDFWPVRRAPEPFDPTKIEQIKEEEEKEKEKALIADAHAELKDRVSELADEIGRIDRKMKEVVQFVSARTRVPSSTASTPMDWEATPDTTRGLKRRKTGDDGAYASDSGSATLGPLSPSLPAPLSANAIGGGMIPMYEYRRLTHRVSKLEASLSELENLHTQAEAQTQEELSALVDTHVERVREELEQGVRARQAERVDRLKEKIGHMDEEVQELVTSVAQLIDGQTRTKEIQSSLEEERQRMEAEREQLRAALEENTSRTASIQAQLTANIEETQALQRAISLATQNQNQPPSPPYTPTIEDLTAALLPRLLDAVRADLEPQLAQHKTDIVTLVRENVPEMDAIREQVRKVMQLPEVLALLQSSGVINVNGTTTRSVVNGMGLEGSSAAIQMNGDAPSPPVKPPPQS